MIRNELLKHPIVSYPHPPYILPHASILSIQTVTPASGAQEVVEAGGLVVPVVLIVVKVGVFVVFVVVVVGQGGFSNFGNVPSHCTGLVNEIAVS